MQNGDSCVVIAGTHKGKAGTVEDRHVSKGGGGRPDMAQGGGPDGSKAADALAAVKAALAAVPAA